MPLVMECPRDIRRVATRIDEEEDGYFKGPALIDRPPPCKLGPLGSGESPVLTSWHGLLAGDVILIVRRRPCSRELVAL